jgi:1-deoxy-D-xylulose-5-phosphate reductoisomerase
MQKITLMGSTGSVGKSALAVIREHPERYAVAALSGGQNVEAMVAQCLEFRPAVAVMADAKAARQVQQQLAARHCGTEVLYGEDALCAIARLWHVDVVIAAIVGTAGLASTLAAAHAGKRILLANKESVVTSGLLLMRAARASGSRILPIDSEHNAIFQCLPEALQSSMGEGELAAYGIAQLVLTGSGGPLRTTPLAELAAVTPDEACAHPTWSMGRKISVDSATMMNKGLEYIEARCLFNAAASEMHVVLHPQSVVHSMVRYSDGSYIAQLGAPDMRTPIAHALAWPGRIKTDIKALDFPKLALSFDEPDPARYPCLFLAMEAYADGQSAATVLNAANEVTVQAFLDLRIGFQAIADINRRTVEALSVGEPSTIGDVLETDRRARELARKYILTTTGTIR